MARKPVDSLSSAPQDHLDALSSGSDLLERELPAEIRRVNHEVVDVEDAATRHDLFIQLGETALEYLASLALSDYRSRTTDPSPVVESLLDRLRTRSPTMASMLELFYESAGAVSDSLFPRSEPLTENCLSQAGRLSAAIESIEIAVGQLESSVALTTVDVDACVTRALAVPTDDVSWWASWKALVEYRNRLTPSASRGWPCGNDCYYDVFAPLLASAVIEILTFPPVAQAILDHPVATLTLITENPDGTVSHKMCGEARGVWFEKDIVASSAITKVWSADEWRATTASKYILETTDSGKLAFRALFWDLHESPPPPIDLPKSSGPAISTSLSPAARLAASTMLEGRGVAPGTCGEFAQGLLPDGTEFHVTCPINKTSSAIVEIREASEHSVTGLQSYQQKLDLALRYACEHLQLGPVAIRVRQWSDLDIGKGMGSSTADVLAGIRAVADAVGTTLSPEVEGRLAARVESSDGTMYAGITVVNQKTGVELRHWAWYPEFVIVMLVPHDNVLTISTSSDGKEKIALRYEALLKGFDDAVEKRSLTDFADLSTRAAALHAEYLVNTYAEVLTKQLRSLGALGLNVGHTGTVCGLLYPNTQDGRERASEVCFEMRQRYIELRDVKVVTTPHCPAL